MRLFSQNDEQEHILRLFGGQTGRFLDIGAYDGRKFSNTHALALSGWSGVCVEPSFDAFAGLAAIYQRNNRIELVNALIGFDWRLVPFWSSPDAVATSDAAHHNKWKGRARFQRIFVPELPLAELLRVHPGPYQFLNIDCEGEATERLFNGFAALNFVEAKVVCVEWNSIPTLKEHMVSVSNNAGFTLQAQNAENLIFSR